MKSWADMRPKAGKCRALGAIATALVAASVSGCVAVPLPPPDDPPFDEESLPFVAGQSTREDVSETLSGIDFSHDLYRFDDDRLWVIHSVSEGWGFFIAGVGSYVGPGASYSRNTRNSYLVLEFDEQGRVSTQHLVTVHWGCKEPGLCRAPYSGGAVGEIMVLADAEADTKAKTFTALTEGCVLYVYADKSFLSTSFPINVTVNNIRLGALTNERAYYRHTLDSGLHAIDATNEFSKEFPPNEPSEIVCEDGNVHFVRIANRGMRVNIQFDSSGKGSKNVLKRQLARAVDVVSQARQKVEPAL